MKLYEIINLKDNPNLTRHVDAEFIGGGAYADVHTDPDDPHMVYKRTPHFDPYNQYLDWIVTNKASQRNPFFPRVYEKRDTEHNRHLQIEKLTSHKTLSSKELAVMSERLLGRSVETFSEFADYIDEAAGINTKLIDELKDPLFKEALRAIAWLSNEHGSSVDIHDDNVMIRRGPTGPQLVITDPLA